MSAKTYLVTDGSLSEAGAKARGLAQLARFASVPPWFVLSQRAYADNVDVHTLAELRAAVARLAPHAERLAVRSSAMEEDGERTAYAGQFESYLNVAPEDVPARVIDVWNSAGLARVEAYRRAHGVTAVSSVPSVIVQRMVNASKSGVAFSADPVNGRRDVVVIAATIGLAEALVAGEEDADTYRVDGSGAIIQRDIARNTTEDRVTLTDTEILRVAALARSAEQRLGSPQDIEWAVEDDVLYALQTRPITSLGSLPAVARRDADSPLTVWDNSNIAESYSGVTTPLTYSFARSVYGEVYREFCRLVGVPDTRIAANTDAFENMLGLVRGRVYYNLASWYQTLALLPGFAINRGFMEQMMGVKDSLPDEIVQRAVAASSRGILSDIAASLRTAVMLLGRYTEIDDTIARFYRRVDAALGKTALLASMRTDELVAHYRDLEARLLHHWDAPLLNDFFAMIFFGLLGRVCDRWCGDASLQNELVRGQAVISVEPVRRIHIMARMARGDAELVSALLSADIDRAVAEIHARPALAAQLQSYLHDFGDRCAGELKLETETLDVHPEPLIRSIGAFASRRDVAQSYDDFDAASAEHRAVHLIGNRVVRRAIFSFVLRHARWRVRDRENLRFERTRVFGRVRRIMLELGTRFADSGLLEAPRDVFYLTIDEVLRAAERPTDTTGLKPLVRGRQSVFRSYRNVAAPPDRFQTRGPIAADGQIGPDIDFHAATAVSSLTKECVAPMTGDARRGIACYPGVITGTARIVRDPNASALAPGEILVAERTDPGWVILFPSAAALVVERGSPLSHAAIVARELRLPAVVSVGGLMNWLRTGDLIQVDGATGIVHRLAHAPESSAVALSR